MGEGDIIRDVAGMNIIEILIVCFIIGARTVVIWGENRSFITILRRIVGGLGTGSHLFDS